MSETVVPHEDQGSDGTRRLDADTLIEDVREGWIEEHMMHSAFDPEPYLRAVAEPGANRQRIAREMVHDLLTTIVSHDTRPTRLFGAAPREDDTDAYALLVQRGLQDALSIDADAAREAMREVYLDRRRDPAVGRPLERALATATMQTGELPVRSDERGTFVRFWGKNVQLPAGVTDIVSAREALSGHALLVERAAGRPELVRVHVVDAQERPTVSGTVMTPHEYADSSYFGEPTRVEAIRDCLNDTAFADRLNDWLGGEYNQAILPLFARARLRESLRDPELGERSAWIMERYGMRALSLFQLLDRNELSRVLPAIEFLSDQPIGAPERDAWGRDVRRSAAWDVLHNVALCSEFAPELIRSQDGQDGSALRIFERRLKDQLVELAALTETQKRSAETGPSAPVTPYDWEMAVNAFSMLGRLAHTSAELAAGREPSLEFEAMNMPPEFAYDTYSFFERHPEAVTTYQTLFEFMTCVHIAQEQDPQVEFHEGNKSGFYTALHEGSKLLEVPTTETDTDTARATNLIDAYVRDGTLNPPLSIAFGGMNTGERFEHRVLTDLEDRGVGFAAIVGIDLQDYSAQARENLTRTDMPREGMTRPDIDYRVGNLATDDFEDLDGTMDVIVAPWSMLNDLLKTMSYAEVLLKFQRYLKPGGILVTDNPFPAGSHSYEKAMIQQALEGRRMGLVYREFEFQGPPAPEGEDDVAEDAARARESVRVDTIFDIRDVRTMTQHALAAGLMPMNFPVDIAEQSTICRRLHDDDSELAALHRRPDDEGAAPDHDPVAYPVYQANNANRMTLALRKSTRSEIHERTGFGPSLLYERAFRQRQEDRLRQRLQLHMDQAA
jgi:hypothetical protein